MKKSILRILSIFLLLAFSLFAADQLPSADTFLTKKELDFKVHHPRPVNLVCDATFHGKRSDGLGTLVFMDSITHEIVIPKHIESEKVADYHYLLHELLSLGYTILSAITFHLESGKSSFTHKNLWQRTGV